MKKITLTITILAIAVTSFAGIMRWTLVNEQKADRGVMCTYEKDGQHKTIWQQSYCPYNLY